MNANNTKTGFEAIKNADFDMIQHMVAVGTLSRETYYQVVQYKLATGQLKNQPRF